MSTRSKINWSDLAHLTVGVWGLGVEGLANAARLEAEGARTVLVDDRPRGSDVGREIIGTSDGGLEVLMRCDAVVKSPGISRYREDLRRIEEAGVSVLGGMGLWFESLGEEQRARVAMVTGTKGKSTTASIAGHLLEKMGYHCFVGGNIGRPPWATGAPSRPDFWIVEASSFHATDLVSSPPVVAVTSLHPDHLDWHGNAETYFADKLSLCTRPGAALTVADGSDRILRSHASLLGPHVRWVVERPDEPDTWFAGLQLLGSHNARNARVARELLRALEVPEAFDETVLAHAALGYRPLPNRLQLVDTSDGVDFVDDGLSTNALSSAAALRSFPTRRVALLVGGHDRGIGFEELAEAVLERNQPTLVVTMPGSGPRIGAAMIAAGVSADSVLESSGLDAATHQAWERVRPGGVVLLSPASPSFGEFRDYRERSEAFAAAVRSCAGSAS